MSLRLRHSPSSSIPVAIARLESHAWIICQRGYANVVALPSSDIISHANTVWGVVYNLSPEDEARLDLYEGHNVERNPTPEPNKEPQTQHIKTHLQGGWDYNKHYLPMTVTKWLRDPDEYGVSVRVGSPPAPNLPPGSHSTTVRALVYVDEFRTVPGKISHEYIGRMNRAIDESVKLGVPQSWVDNVMRQFIPSGIHVNQHDYVGTDQGYIDGEELLEN